MAKTNKYASINFNEVYGKKPNNTNPPPSPNPSATRPRHSSHGGMLVLTRPSKPQLANLNQIHKQNQNQNQPKSSFPPPDLQNPANPTHFPDSIEPPHEQLQQPHVTDSKVESSDSISLRPLGRRDGYTTPSTQIAEEKIADNRATEPDLLKESSGEAKVLDLAKPEPFRPPHLRPGFNGRGSHERSGQDGEEHKREFFRNPKVFRPGGNRDFQRDFHGRNHSFGHGQIRETSTGSLSPSLEQTRPKSGGNEGMRRLPESGGNRSNPTGRSASPWPDSKTRPSSGGGRSSSGGWSPGSSDCSTGKSPHFYNSHRSPPAGYQDKSSG